MGKFIDLTGQKFGRLTVIERVYPKNKGTSAYWKCICSCKDHNIVIASTSSLRQNRKSCGCINKELHLKTNSYILKDGYYEVYDNMDRYFLIDEEDYDKIKNYSWYINTSGYVAITPAFRGKTDNKENLLHRYLISPGKENVVDHINHNRLDNRKHNLRICNTMQNNQNSIIRMNNTSDIIGIWYDNKNEKWASEIRVNKKKIWLGRYHNKKDAIVARLKAEKEYFGEFAPQQHLYEQYEIE